MAMAAPVGNQFWLKRSTHGRKPLFATPEILWDACCEYFQWVEENPLYETKAFAFQGVVTQEAIPKMRAMTIDGLCIFLDIDPVTWREYGRRQDFTSVCSNCERIIRSQKFAGAAADLLNANIIARDLGLADKSELTGAGGGPIITSNMTPDEAYKAMLSLGK